MAAHPPLIQALCRLLEREGPVDVRETHISWVVLAGEDAYKIKKPVDFGFLDFSTLEKRRFYCQEELRLNRRLAPDLYLDVLSVVGSPAQPHFADQEEGAIEYAVHMRRFAEEACFASLAQAGELRREHMDALAELLADFHARIPRSTAEDGHGLPEHFLGACEENFAALLQENVQNTFAPGVGVAYWERVVALRDWTAARREAAEPLLWQRKQQGFMRECHGDLHLANLVLYRGQPLPFDCIEFSEKLRWVDVLSELAFTAMDLEAHGLESLAWRLVNRYLEHSGDYAGLALWDDYRVYRALVRAKVAALSSAALAVERYLSMAEAITRRRRPWLAITRGVSGSGKTRAAGILAETMGALRLRSDVERKRLFGLPPLAASQSGPDSGLYAADATRRTYQYLLDTAEGLLRGGLPAVVDATFLRRVDRDAFRRLATGLDVPFLILDVTAPDALLRQRILARQGRDASEATLDILARQQAGSEALGEDERLHAVGVDTAGRGMAGALAECAARLA